MGDNGRNHTATAVGEGAGVADGLFIVDTDGSVADGLDCSSERAWGLS